MGTKSKRKGKGAESQIVAVARNFGLDADRTWTLSRQGIGA